MATNKFKSEDVENTPQFRAEIALMGSEKKLDKPHTWDELGDLQVKRKEETDKWVYPLGGYTKETAKNMSRLEREMLKPIDKLEGVNASLFQQALLDNIENKEEIEKLQAYNRSWKGKIHRFILSIYNRVMSWL